MLAHILSHVVPCHTFLSSGNLYIADSYFSIRKVSTSGIITTFAGSQAAGSTGDFGAATSSLLSSPYGVTTDASNNVYVVDTYNNRIRKVDSSTGIITTIAGTGTLGSSGDDGAASLALLNHPIGAAVDASGNIYIADNSNHVVRLVAVDTGIITTFAGGGIVSSYDSMTILRCFLS